MKIELMDPNEIIIKPCDMPPLHGRPPRRDDNEAFDKLCRTVKAEGVLVPIVINPRNECRIGHHRLWAAQAVGLDLVPVSRDGGK